MVPTPESSELAAVLKAQRDEHGFFNEAHPKLRPVETLTAGYFLAGAGQGPKDIPEAVAQASGAASKVIGLFANEKLSHEPPIAAVDEDLCSGCGVCVEVCPYRARELIEKDVQGTKKKVIKVNEVLCEACGACSSACPVGACPQRNLGDEQIQAMVRAGLEA
jgi:heterodisulfide reductase subunit A